MPRLFTLILALFLLTACNVPTDQTAGTAPRTPAQMGTATSSNTGAVYYPVVKIVDGDTIDVSLDGKTERVRIIGIDTPESVDPRRPVQCFGREATQRITQLLSNRKVRLEPDPTQADRDRHKRILRFVFLENGTDIGLILIKEGYSHEYTYNLPYKYQKAYKQAENEAREAGRGLWAADACAEKNP